MNDMEKTAERLTGEEKTIEFLEYLVRVTSFIEKDVPFRFFTKNFIANRTGETLRATYICAKKAFVIALKALYREQERENPKPLTVEELREMAERCEPIYITRIDDETPIFKGNKIVGGVLDKAAVMNVADHLPFMAIYGRNMTLAESDYGKTWLAYRTKPTGGGVKGLDTTLDYVGFIEKFDSLKLEKGEKTSEY